MSLESPAVSSTYETLIAKVRIQGGEFRRQALATPAPSSDAEIEVGWAFQYQDSMERQQCYEAMRRQLTIWRNVL